MKTLSKSLIAITVLIVLFVSSFSVASENEYASYCEDLSCAKMVIGETSDPSLCENLNDSGNCYQMASRLLNDSSLCFKAENSSGCLYSYALRNEDHTICQQLGALLDKCIFDVAVRRKDSSLCQDAKDPYYCFYSYAVWSGDVKICDFSEKYKNACIEKILEAKS